MGRIPRSIRLSPELDRRLDQAATRQGVSKSEFIRFALAERCEAVLDADLADQLGDFIGAVRSSGSPSARDAGRQYGAKLAASRSRKENRS